MVLMACSAFGAPFDSQSYVMTNRIEFVCPYHPYFASNNPLERVRIDLSIDGGSTYSIPIAYGLPTHWGTNTFDWSVRMTPAIWTEHARVAVRTLWSSTTNALILHMGDQSDTDFILAGLRIISPAPDQVVYSPSYLPVTWHEAGADRVQIGTSTDGVNYALQAECASLSPTNSFTIGIEAPAGPLWIVVQSPDHSNLYHTVRVQIQPQE